MRIASLGSGSKGNATLVDTGETLLLIDCGLPRRDVEKRLQSRGVSGQDIDAILVTHEHGDHCRGVVPLARAYDLPVFLTAGTAGSRKLEELQGRVVIRPGDQFAVGDVDIAAEPVPHDAREPVQFCLTYNDLKLGVLTDLGHYHAARCASVLRLRRAGARIQSRPADVGRRALPPCCSRGESAAILAI